MAVKLTLSEALEDGILVKQKNVISLGNKKNVLVAPFGVSRLEWKRVLFRYLRRMGKHESSSDGFTHKRRTNECILKELAFHTEVFLEERLGREFAEVHARPLAFARLQVAAPLHLDRASPHLLAGLHTPAALLAR